ncbi:tRNA preQ1(34) S-adenosylmethionine ribosyltransferase-isomerase QueA [Acetobacterium fimetarium]|uniref:S-adenosylmethionine:tRNA ribosyltransferase-isomerase n=1 Tax=Acetobacterium fimetarium TaxID=52691 RepID=A0ABR6WZ27_9FIRM|nr:tRNA preQ1(34) S-adenosylmethionine ribosyltransferase-isomerase QueA [Acetobacterium fimetarium]MBC3805454.1 tRNA preQ1(34) S-adenosylmethionine ribosyltransferase-isomerase QueA [Acetobacterium fimetarium]
MNRSDFYYDLPEELIAQHPLKKRDESRLMVINRKKNTIEDRRFFDVTEYLRPGDLLVMNNTKVIPGRIYGHREDTGGKVEILLLRHLSDKDWEIMVKPGKRAKVGARIVFSPELKGVITGTTQGGLRVISFEYTGIFKEIVNEIGLMPVPPYIHETLADNNRYQTVYAKREGSSAAPTAGLHFTPDLLEKIEKMGVSIAEVTLHVGIGTFRPVKCDVIEEHHMHEEYFEVPEETAKAIKRTKKNGGRVIAVGTTSVRTLESDAQFNEGSVEAYSGVTDIFIYPGYEWKVVDAMITNFHLPESTLLMLVSAFYNREAIMKAYQTAIDLKYRFFSFGDAMFIE